MIKTFIFVEDGSVDIEELKNSVNRETLVVAYRQGTRVPQIQQPASPVYASDDDDVNKFREDIGEFFKKALIGDCYTMNYFMRRDIEVLCEKYFGKKEMKK